MNRTSPAPFYALARLVDLRSTCRPKSRILARWLRIDRPAEIVAKGNGQDLERLLETACDMFTGGNALDEGFLESLNTRGSLAGVSTFGRTAGLSTPGTSVFRGTKPWP